jgi:aspartate/methionine/tyrosine aminotransferase
MVQIHRSTCNKQAKRVFKASRTDSLSSTSVWTEFTPLAQKYGAVNLGQGFPDFHPESFILDAAKDAIDRKLVQYTRSQGHIRLVNALSKVYSPLLGQTLNPLQNIVATIGATEAIYVSIMAFCNPGDEVVLFEPFYDSYPACVNLAGGKPVFVPLRPQHPNSSAADWKLDINELKAAITPKTKMILVNNPSNIPGKVWTRNELEQIAKLAVEKDLLVVSDEVYEWMVYEDSPSSHIRMATLPGMWERTITIGSAGKAFSVTGYKVGWLFADTPLVEVMQSVHTNAVFSVSAPVSEAVAVALEESESRGYFLQLRDMFAAKREKLTKVLNDAGLKTITPHGSYFILADTSKIDPTKFLDEKALATGAADSTRDYQFCRWLTTKVGVAAIPPSAFYSKEHAHMASNYARFAFCKKDESFELARERFNKL